MTYGVIATLEELIAYKSYAQIAYKFKNSSPQGGTQLTKVRGRGMDFAEIRNYQAGDEIRHMEWRSTARIGRPHIKLYQEEKERSIILLCDFNPSMYFGTRQAFKSVIAARLAAMLAWSAMGRGDRVGGLIFSAHTYTAFSPRSRHLGVLPMLAALSQYTQFFNKSMAKPRMLSDALLRLRRVIKPGSMVIILSDFMALDTESERSLSQLRSRNEVLAYHIVDKLELAPPKPAFYPITDGKTTLILDTTNKQIARRYQNYCEQRMLRIQTLCKGLRISYSQIATTDDLYHVGKFFTRRVANG